MLHIELTPPLFEKTFEYEIQLTEYLFKTSNSKVINKNKIDSEARGQLSLLIALVNPMFQFETGCPIRARMKKW